MPNLPLGSNLEKDNNGTCEGLNYNMKTKGIPYSEVKAKALMNKLVWKAYQRERRSEAMKSIINAMALIGVVALIKYIIAG